MGLATLALNVSLLSRQSKTSKMANRSRSSMDRSAVADNLENPGVECFWTIELNAEKRTHTWHVDPELEEGDKDFLDHTLFLKQAVLGEGTVAGQSNIVMLESPVNKEKAEDEKDEEKVMKGAIVHLEKGVNNMCHLDLSLNGETGGTFTLIGDGPVYITGLYLQEFPRPEAMNDTVGVTDDSIEESEEEVDDAEAEEPEEEEVEEEEEKVEVKPAKGKKAAPKRKVSPKAGKQNKQKQKVEVEDDDEEMDSEDDEEEDDSDYEEEKIVPKKAKKPAAAKDTKKGKAKTP